MDAAELAREVNRRIYEIAVRFGDDLDINYLCECGCMGVVARRPSDYVRVGALRPNHVQPLAAAGHEQRDDVAID